MADAAADSETSWLAVRCARAECNWAQMTIKINVDSNAASLARGEGTVSTELPGIAGIDAPADVVDLSNWQRLEHHLREELGFGADGKLLLVLQHSALNADVTISNSTSLHVLHRNLDAHADSMDDPITLRARLHSPPTAAPAEPMIAEPTATIPDTVPPLQRLLPGAIQLSEEMLERRLKRLCYPAHEPRERGVKGGTWTEECTECMASNPKHLLMFDELRNEGFGRALGSGNYLINPIAVCCPGCGMVLRLDVANKLTNLQKHVEEAHGKKCTLAKRLSLAMEQRLVTAEQLNAEAAPLERMQLYPPPSNRADFFARPRASHWLLPWVEVYLLRFGTQHVAVQKLLAVLYFLVGWNVISWKKHVPVLLAFAHEVYYAAKPKGLNLTRGRGFFGQGRTSETIIRVESFEAAPTVGMLVCCVPEAAPWVLHLTAGAQFAVRSAGAAITVATLAEPPAAAPPSGATLFIRLGNTAQLPLQAHSIELVRIRELEPEDVNLWLPPQQTLRADELPPRYTTSTHFHKIGALLTMAASIPSIPVLRSREGEPACVVVLGAVQFDERPLNKAAFARIDAVDGRWVAQLHGMYETDSDGTLQPIDVARAKELRDAGNSATRKALTSAVFTSSVKEYMFSTLDGALKMNTRTEYLVTDERSRHVKLALKAARREVRVCLCCIKDGCPDQCSVLRIGDACGRCQHLGCQCTYLSDVFDLCDQGSAQRKAFGELDEQIDKQAEELSVDTGGEALRDVRYQRVGHGMLHGVKSCVGVMRNYRATDGSTGEASVRMLLAVATSDTQSATELLAAASRDVFKALDRHSDQVAYETVHRPVQDVLRSIEHVKDTVLPEPYKIWSTRCETHDTLSWPTSVAFNWRGEGIFSDADGHVIAMFTRHWPAKVIIAAGTWGETGRPKPGNVRGSESLLNQPMQLAILTVKPGKDERAFFVDVGNGVLRVLEGVHDAEATHKHKISTVSIRSLNKVQAVGLAIVRSKDGSGTLRPLLAMSEVQPPRLRLVQLDDSTCASGALISELEWELQSPWGLGVRDGVVFVADGPKVRYCKVAEEERRAPSTAAAGARRPIGMLTPTFREARAVALTQTTLAVADSAANQVFIFKLDGLQATQSSVWGTGARANLDGPIAAVAFNEPCCLAYGCGTLLVGCYGGGQRGTISVVTPTSFAVKLLASLESIYDAIGFVSAKLPRSEHQRARAARDVPMLDGIESLKGAVEFLLSIPAARSNALSGLSADGAEGSLHLRTVEGMAFTVKHVAGLAKDLQAVGIDVSKVILRALLNESLVESQYGHQVIMTQADHPTQKEHTASKPKSDRSALNRQATPAFSNFTGQWSQYQAPHVSSVSAAQLYQLMARFYHELWPLPAAPSGTEMQALKDAMHHLQAIASVGGQQRCANARAKYKRPCGVNPTIFVNLAADWAAEQPASTLASFIEEIRLLVTPPRTLMAADGGRVAAGRSDAALSRDDYVMKSGDIGFIKGGVIVLPDKREIADGEDVWAFQVREAFERDRMRPGCRVKIFWLQRVGRSNTGPEEAKSKWSLLPNSADSITYHRLLKEAGEPIVVRVETLTSGWDSVNGTVYELEDELVEKLTSLAASWGRAPARVEVRATDSDADEGDGEEGDGADQDESGAGLGDWRGAALIATDTATQQTVLAAVREGEQPVGRRASRRLAGCAAPPILPS